MNPLWGIDLGGTKIEGVVIESKDNPNVLARMRVPTEQQGGYGHIIQQISKLIGMLEQETGLRPERVGMGTPGTLDPATQLMKNCNTTSLNNQPLRKDLETQLGIPFTLANDANCFAVAEARFGAAHEVAPNATVVFGVILGTGVGGGLVVNGKAINGKQGIAGEWGHNFLDESGGRCYCGKIGCVETIISGPALERHYQSLTGTRLKLREIAERSGHEDAARQTIQRLTHYFGKAISVIINVLDPDVIVLGGGVGNIQELYTEGVEAAKSFVFNTGVKTIDTVFLRPKLGDSAGVFGAALLVA
ncbi:MAG TPA: ROK family protein [Saprospiraceae bacterium]|nr:ROK family protein [Saprospiraceae bacterium]HMP25373.1 ROK family protein [Saprospiraceae bacterium]